MRYRWSETLTFTHTERKTVLKTTRVNVILTANCTALWRLAIPSSSVDWLIGLAQFHSACSSIRQSGTTAPWCELTLLHVWLLDGWSMHVRRRVSFCICIDNMMWYCLQFSVWLQFLCCTCYEHVCRLYVECCINKLLLPKIGQTPRQQCAEHAPINLS